MDATLSNELSTLRELVSTLQSALQAAQIENKLRRQKLAHFLKRYFGGAKNESLDRAQLELLLAGLEALPVSAPVAEPRTSARVTSTVRPVRQPCWRNNFVTVGRTSSSFAPRTCLPMKSSAWPKPSCP